MSPSQRNTFILTTRERTHGLTRLLDELAPLFALRLENRGAGWSQTRPIDAGKFALVMQSNEVGVYEYNLSGQTYSCVLDLSGIPPDKYTRLLRSIRERYPEIIPADYQSRTE